MSVLADLIEHSGSDEAWEVDAYVLVKHGIRIDVSVLHNERGYMVAATSHGPRTLSTQGNLERTREEALAVVHWNEII